MKKLLKPLLIVMFIIQLGVPAYMIYEQTQILSTGTEFKFKTRPIDPYDPFRGRYVTLRYEANSGMTPSNGESFERGDWVYAYIVKNAEGFAEFSKLSSEKPKDGAPYLYTEVTYGGPKNGYRIKLAFNRYYASEETAPNIEKVVWRRQGGDLDNVYSLVRILEGKATLKELYIDGMPVRDYLEQVDENSQ